MQEKEYSYGLNVITWLKELCMALRMCYISFGMHSSLCIPKLVYQSTFINKSIRNLQSHDHSKCIRPTLPPYSVYKQTVLLKLGGSFVSKNCGVLCVYILLQLFR